MSNKVTPATMTLNRLGKGMVVDDLTEQLAEVVKGVRETGKKGTVSLTIEVSMLSKTNEDQVKVIPKVTSKVPQHDAPTTVMFSTADGDLLSEDPNAVDPTQLRSVEAAPQKELRRVGEE